MSTMRCFTDWNEAIGRSKTTRAFAYSTASSSARSGDADQLGCERHRRRRRARRARAAPGHRPVRSARRAPRRAPAGRACGSDRAPGPARLGARGAGRSARPPRRAPPRSPSPRCGRRPRSAWSRSGPTPTPSGGHAARTVESGWPCPCSCSATVPAASARRQPAEELVGAEGASGQGGRDRRGEEGARKGHPAHLLEHDAHLEEARLPRPAPACRSSRAPPGAPRARSVTPDGIVRELAQRVAADVVHRLARDVLERELFGVECEVHCTPPWRRLADVGDSVDGAYG